jgi:hypothetical protein
MEDLSKLKTLWQSAKPVVLPDAIEIQKTIKQFRNVKLRNKILSVTVALTVCLMSLTFLVLAKNLMITTQAALILNTVACLTLAVSNLRSMKRFINLKDFSNLEFLQFLQQTRKNQIYYHRRTQVVGLILVTSSTLLFPYQFVKHSFVLGTITYLIALAWLVILWFYIRPRSFKKHFEKLNAELLRFENIIQQTF